METRDTIETKLQQIFMDIFRLEPELIKNELTPAEIPNWDSFQHLNLAVTIEERFDVSLTPEEIEAMRGGFGAIKEILRRKGVAE